MLSITELRDNFEDINNRLRKRGRDFEPELNELIRLDDARKHAQTELDAVLAESNAAAKEIGILFKAGKAGEANVLKEKTSTFKQVAKGLEEVLKSAEAVLFEALVQIPNAPHSTVPNGRTPDDNEIVLTYGNPPELTQSKPHWELTEQYDLIDFELGVKVTGAGFPVYKGKGARLQRALINFFLDEAIKEGYLEIQPPILINEASGFGTGQLPDKEGQMYHSTVDDLFLIPTAEVPITNMYRDVIVEEKDLPIKNAAYTPCFRREAGSYGKDVRGLNRLHQFDKVEIVQLATPDQSYAILENMSAYVQGLLKKLGLHYRVLRLCGGDMGFTAALTYDMEVYSAAQEKWLEVSSVSCFESFQSNRLKLRYRDVEGRRHMAHTLNGSALALPRIVAALLENNQTKNGIEMPEVLHPYLGFKIIS
ncbi:MAG: seryl-tRNA synthetase [Bacteroidia bacterium]|jgi:seryl-tRNA synthetase